MTSEETKEKSEEKEIVFYCKDCGHLVETNRCGRKYVYKCKLCGTKNVAFGTLRSIRSFFHIKEGEEHGVIEEEEVVEKAVEKEKK
ncbi:hypothetical protein ACFL21_01260 [Patescibacteria group bacterium]